MAKKRGNGLSITTVMVLAIAILLVPVVYVLSAGPALWLVHHGYLDTFTYLGIYQPMFGFAYNHQTFNEAMNWYLSWWGGPIDLSP